MGKTALARERESRPPKPARDGSRAPRHRQEAVAPHLDRLIHERIRLGIVSALAVNESLSFNDLKAAPARRPTATSACTRASSRKPATSLCAKSFEGRLPKTEFRLSAAGRRALTRYLDHMEALIRAARVGQ